MCLFINFPIYLRIHLLFASTVFTYWLASVVVCAQLMLHVLLLAHLYILGPYAEVEGGGCFGENLQRSYSSISFDESVYYFLS